MVPLISMLLLYVACISYAITTSVFAGDIHWNDLSWVWITSLKSNAIQLTYRSQMMHKVEYQQQQQQLNLLPRLLVRDSGNYALNDKERVDHGNKNSESLSNSDDMHIKGRVIRDECVRMDSAIVPFKDSYVCYYQYAVDNLNPNIDYKWKLINPSNNIIKSGSFRTPSLEFIAYNYTFAAASCADNDSNSEIFDMIINNGQYYIENENKPLFFLHMGDLHYGNIEIDDKMAFLYMYDRTLGQPRQNSFFSNIPVIHMWDDHDYGPNNSDKYSKGRKSSIESRNMVIPSYYSDKNSDKMYYTFVIGRVAFIITDLRAHRIPDVTSMGKEQLIWFKDTLIAFDKMMPSKIGKVIWMSTEPWIDDYFKWGSFPEERNDIAKFLTALPNVQKNFIIIGGDAHMIAVDDGSHSAGHVPVFQAAALDAKPTTKGGPYSHNVFPGRGQYSTVDIVDNGVEKGICVIFRGWRMNKDKKGKTKLIEFNTCHPERSPKQLYKPSPMWAQLLWKEIKHVLENEKRVGKPFVTYVDSSTWTFTIENIILIFSYIMVLIAAVWGIANMIRYLIKRASFREHLHNA